MNQRCSHRSTPIHQTNWCVAEIQPKPAQRMIMSDVYSERIIVKNPYALDALVSRKKVRFE